MRGEEEENPENPHCMELMREEGKNVNEPKMRKTRRFTRIKRDSVGNTEMH